MMFCVKMSGYSQIICCLQEKSTHFGLEVSVVYVTLCIFWDKMSQQSDKKNFKLYQVFLQIFSKRLDMHKYF